MSNLKHLKSRVVSIKSTKKITKAMQLVSAAKLKRIKEKAEALDEYSAVLGDIMCDIAVGGSLLELPPEDRIFFSHELKNMTNLLVVMTSERGLCGGFNANIIKAVRVKIANLAYEGIDTKLLVIGAKGLDALKREFNDKIIEDYHVFQGNYEYVAYEVKAKIISLVESRQIGACYMYYNRFKNAMTRIVTEEQILPAHLSSGHKAKSVFEYEGAGLVHNIINLYISGQINYGLLQSRAGEEGARMTAMENATKNAGELIDKITLELNRSRQAMITTELNEIISGAESI